MLFPTTCLTVIISLKFHYLSHLSFYHFSPSFPSKNCVYVFCTFKGSIQAFDEVNSESICKKNHLLRCRELLLLQSSKFSKKYCEIVILMEFKLKDIIESNLIALLIATLFGNNYC